MPTATSYTNKLRYLAIAKNVKVQLPGGVSNTFRPGLSDMCSDFKTTPEITTTTGGIITTICGNGTNTSTGDGGLAVNATMRFPSSIAVDSSGNIFVIDSGTGPNYLRKIDTNGIITTIATISSHGVIRTFDSNNNIINEFNGNPTETEMKNISLDNNTGDIYILLTLSVYKLTPSAHTPSVYNISFITNVDFVFPYSSPNDYFSFFSVFAFNSETKNLYVVKRHDDYFDGSTYRTIIKDIYRVPHPYTTGSAFVLGSAPGSGIQTVNGITLDSEGRLYSFDSQSNKVRVYNMDGTLRIEHTEIFRDPSSSSSKFGIRVDSIGNIFVANSIKNIIRKVDTSGNITTVAGLGTQPPFSGDGGNSLQSNLNIPLDLAIDSKSNLFICDGLNRRVRKVTPAVTTTTLGKTTYNPPWFTPVEYRELCDCKLLAPPEDTLIIYDGQ